MNIHHYGRLRTEVLPPKGRRRQRQLLTPLKVCMTEESPLSDILIWHDPKTNKPFISDFSSTPLLLLGFLDAGSEAPSIHHDFGCKFGYLPSVTGARLVVTRSLNDKLYYEGLRANGVGKVRARTMYYGVRSWSIAKSPFTENVYYKG